MLTTTRYIALRAKSQKRFFFLFFFFAGAGFAFNRRFGGTGSLSSLPRFRFRATALLAAAGPICPHPAASDAVVLLLLPCHCPVQNSPEPVRARGRAGPVPDLPCPPALVRHITYGTHYAADAAMLLAFFFSLRLAPTRSRARGGIK